MSVHDIPQRRSNKPGLQTCFLNKLLVLNQSLAQHHDEVIDTEKQHVAYDYAERLAIGYIEDFQGIVTWVLSDGFMPPWVFIKRACRRPWIVFCSLGFDIAFFFRSCLSLDVLESVGEIRSFENPKHKITAVLAKEEEIWGATFKAAKKDKTFAKHLEY
ncbi:hypothetical protein ACFE04_000713 [Oxalis oulophora]